MPEAQRPGRALLICCILAVLSGSIFSLFGPSRYWSDQDRDFERTAQLLEGDLTLLFQGSPASQTQTTTAGGVIYAILAPVMAISGNPVWLYVWLNLLLLLAALPLWYLARHFGGLNFAWISVALFMISSGRIVYGNHGLHAFVAITPAMLWHLALLRFVERPRRSTAVVILLLTWIVIALHLSYLALLLAAPLMIAAYRFRNRLPAWTPARLSWVIKAAAVLLAIGFAGLWWSGRSATAISFLHRLLNGIASVGEHTGFVIEDRTLHYRAVDKLPWLFLLLPVTALGFYEMWRARSSLLASERLPLIRHWVFWMTAVQLAAAVAMVPLWYTDRVWGRYRNISSLAPILILALAAGLMRLGHWISQRSRGRVTPNTAAALIVAGIGAGHLAAIMPLYSQMPWRLTKHPIRPELSRHQEAVHARWAVSADWLEKHAFLDPEIAPDPEGLRLLYLQQSFRHRFRSQASQWPAHPRSSSEVLYLVRPDSHSERLLLKTQEVLDKVDAGSLRAYLCQRSAKALLPFEAWCHYLAWSSDSMRFSEYWVPYVEKDIVKGQRSYPLIASNIALPSDLESEILFEVVVESLGEELWLGARLYGSGTNRQRCDDQMLGPHILVRTARGEEHRLDIDYSGFLESGDRSCLSATLILSSADKIEDVLCGVDSYLDPSHYDEPRVGRWSVTELARRYMSRLE